MWMRRVAIVAALTMAGLVGGADAQQPGAASGPGPWMMSYGHWGRWLGWGSADEQLCSGMLSHLEGRLAYQKAELKITAAQEPLWAAYVNTARENAQTLSARCTTMLEERTQALALPDRLDLREQLMAARLTAMRASDEALKPLYAALDDGQKQIADRLFWGRMRYGGLPGMM
jgi:hypothetical protein